MEIIDILKIEKKLLLELLNMVEEEKEALIKSDIDKISRLTKVKEELKDKIDSVEKDRLALCGTKRIKDVLDELNEDEKKKAEAIGKEIEEIVLKIQETNETNSLLLRQSLSYTRMMLSALSPKKSPVYRPTGRLEDSASQSNLLNKSV